MHNKIKQANKKFYDRVTENYNEINLRSHRKMEFNISRILEDLGKRTGNKSMLDLCCGTGVISFYGKRYFKDTYGVDISLNMLRIANKHTGAICADATLLPFKNKLFEVITCYGSLHHIYDFKPLFKEVFRVLKKGGYFYIDHEINKNFMRRYKRLIELYRYFFGVEKKYLRKNKDLDANQYRLANYHTYVRTGIEPQEVIEELHHTGFQEVKINYHCAGMSVAINYLMTLLKVRSFPEFISPFFVITAQKV